MANANTLIYFPYPFTEADLVSIQVPTGILYRDRSARSGRQNFLMPVIRA